MSSPSSAPQPPTALSRPRADRLRALLTLVLLCAIVAAVYAGWTRFRLSLPRELAEAAEIRADLNQPDALIESASLAALPRDLLKVPLLRDTLTEEFVFYYEQHADRLGLAGALRRIAYEHELDLRDSLINELLDQPAEVALWRGADGKLAHAMLVMRRGALARLLQPLARVALDDRQLSRVASLRVGGSEVPLYRLRHNPGRSLLFAAHGDRLLVVATPGLLLRQPDSDQPELAQAPARLAERLLSGEHRFAPRFGLVERERQHRITIAGDYLALGYGSFLSALQGLSFELDGADWHSQVALAALEPDAPAAALAPLLDPLWRAMPADAAVCVAAPVAPRAVGTLIGRFVADATLAGEVAARLGDAVGLCWYDDSRLHTPLVVLPIRPDSGEALDPPLADVFARVVGAREPRAEGGRFAVSALGDGVPGWQRVVSSRFGLYPGAVAEEPELLAEARFFRVTLARHRDTLVFSLDDRLVRNALAALDKRRTPVADLLPPGGAAPVYVAPERLARLVAHEALTSLPAEVEPVFRNAAQAHLLPRLDALAAHPPFALTLPSDASARGDWTWVPVQWSAR